MNYHQLFLTAMRSLKNHKTRSLLTTLGIIIGVISIIAVMSIGQGAKNRVNKEIEKLGTNFIIVLGSSPKHIGQRSGAALTIKPADMRAVQEECELVRKISPGIQFPTTVIYEGSNWQTTVTGVNEDYLEIRQWPMASGEFLSEQDIRSSNKVAIIGKTIVKELFGSQDPIGKIIRIKKLPFKVIGVLSEKGKMPNGRDEDDMIFAPVTAVQRKLMGKLNYGALIMSGSSKATLSTAASQVRSIIRQQHKLQDLEEDDFTIFTQNDIAQASEAASTVVNLLLLIVASISLLVGGIGIMNIMLVTVTERTKEIGIRMALGATTRVILSQFILEAISICLAGGLVGVLFGIGVSNAVGFALGWPIFISESSIVISLCSCILIGLFFGYYPAYKAAHLNPVEALLDR